MRVSTLSGTVRPARGRMSSSQTRSMLAVRGVSVAVDRDVEPLDRHRLDVVAEHHRQRTGHGRRRAENRVLVGEDVLEREIAVPLQPGAALDRERGGAVLPLVGAERVEHRDVGEERREQLIVDEVAA